MFVKNYCQKAVTYVVPGARYTVMFLRGLLMILSQGIVADFCGVGCLLFQRVSLNNFNFLNPSGTKGGGSKTTPPRFFLCSIC